MRQLACLTLAGLTAGSSGCDEGIGGADVDLIAAELEGNTTHMVPDVAEAGVSEWWLGLEHGGSTVACNCIQEFPTATWSFDEASQELTLFFDNGATETYTFSDTASDKRSGRFHLVLVNAIETVDMDGGWTFVDGTDVCPAPAC